MRKFWNRLLVKLGLRKPRIWYGARAEVSIIGKDGKRVVLDVIKNVSFGPAQPLILGRQRPVPRTDEEARLFRERHCVVCLQVPSPCCGALRNTPHAEWCTHVCTHSYQRFAP